MRRTSKEKEEPHLMNTADADLPDADPAPAKPRRRKRSEDQRLNLKRSYQAFLETARKVGGAAKVPALPRRGTPALTRRRSNGNALSIGERMSRVPSMTGPGAFLARHRRVPAAPRDPALSRPDGFPQPRASGDPVSDHGVAERRLPTTGDVRLGRISRDRSCPSWQHCDIVRIFPGC